MAYYKTSDAGVLAAWSVYREGCDRLKVSADAFAASYQGATALMRTDWHSGKSFYGLKFEPPIPHSLSGQNLIRKRVSRSSRARACRLALRVMSEKP